MEIEIYGNPKFYIPLTKEHVAVLTKLSGSHYDGVCKSASRLGGFIYGWKNLVEFATNDEATPCHASGRELDTCLKILEMSVFGKYTNEEMLLIEEMIRDFHGAYKHAVSSSSGWSTTYTGRK